MRDFWFISMFGSFCFLSLSICCTRAHDATINDGKAKRYTYKPDE